MRKLVVFLGFILAVNAQRSSGSFININGLQGLPEAPDPIDHRDLGADPYYDSRTALSSSKLQIFANKLLAKEAHRLADLDVDQVDFNLWRSDLLSKFSIRQDSIPYRNDADRDRDYASFGQALKALATEVQKDLDNQRTKLFDYASRRGYSSGMKEYRELTDKLQESSDQYKDLVKQRMKIFVKLRSIACTVNGNSSAESLPPIYGANSQDGIPPDPSQTGLPTADYPAFIMDPTYWMLPLSVPTDNPTDEYAVGPRGVVEGPDYDTVWLDDSNNACKMAVLYDKLMQLFRDYSSSNRSYRRTLRKTFTRLQQLFLDLFTKYQDGYEDLRRINQKISSVGGRLDELKEKVAEIQNYIYGSKGYYDTFTDKYDVDVQ